MTAPPANPTADDYAPVMEKLTEFIKAERKSKRLAAVSIALVDQNHTVWQQGFGTVDTRSRQPVTDSTVYRVGSVSKLFTDMLVVQLAQEGKLDLDADIREYLPEFAPENPYDKPITLRQLMCHRSGIVREPPVGHYFDPTEPTLEATVNSLNETKLVHPPETNTKYSNAAVSVVGRVAEVVGNQPFAELATDRLLVPLGMQHSDFVRTDEIDRLSATGWMWSVHAPRTPAPTFALGTAPAGNLYCTVGDLANFVAMVCNQGKFAGQQIMPAEVIREMLTPAADSTGAHATYGLGFRLSEIEGHRTFGHGGAVYGFSTNVLGLPDDEIGVVVTSAVDCSNGFTSRVCEYAVRLLLAHRAGEPLPECPTSKRLPENMARSLEGPYACNGETLHLLADDNKLYMEKGYQRRELRSLTDNTLVVDDLDGYGPQIKLSDSGELSIDGNTWQRQPDTCPPECPEHFQQYIGIYGWDHNKLYVFERDGQLWALIEWFFYYPLTEVEKDVFAFPAEGGLYEGEQLVFERNEEGEIESVEAACVDFKRLLVGESLQQHFELKPTKPVEELRRMAAAADPPREPRKLREFDLVELDKLAPGIHLDIRYATTRNFMGTPFYTSAHAMMQRPAAEATAAAQEQLEASGYGLLIHDAYRPWVVTKMFWDGTPAHLRRFVADPDYGSRHNRGCAVDLTLYDLQTGEPIDMTSLYDEFSERSYPLYPGGTARQRWHRRLLRNMMEDQGFKVFRYEWWHFDYETWSQYPIGKETFEEILSE
ncbi:serine hydrolase [Aeoliella mucimassa]|uniref:serine hydrolase n=1 Tax=Aeoliella mucimassa TaxID=2527972 RepID=UPI0018D450DE|nr:serine hydrolase [Aeoliella mucimassa]